MSVKLRKTDNSTSCPICTRRLYGRFTNRLIRNAKFGCFTIQVGFLQKTVYFAALFLVCRMRENCVTKQESRDIARGVAWVFVFHIGKREDPGDEVNASAFTVLMSLWKHSDCSQALYMSQFTTFMCWCWFDLTPVYHVERTKASGKLNCSIKYYS